MFTTSVVLLMSDEDSVSGSGADVTDGSVSAGVGSAEISGSLGAVVGSDGCPVGSIRVGVSVLSNMGSHYLCDVGIPPYPSVSCPIRR